MASKSSSSRDEIIALSREGFSVNEIADAYGVSTSEVSWVLSSEEHAASEERWVIGKLELADERGWAAEKLVSEFGRSRKFWESEAERVGIKLPGMHAAPAGTRKDRASVKARRDKVISLAQQCELSNREIAEAVGIAYNTACRIIHDAGLPTCLTQRKLEAFKSEICSDLASGMKHAAIQEKYGIPGSSLSTFARANGYARRLSKAEYEARNAALAREVAAGTPMPELQHGFKMSREAVKMFVANGGVEKSLEREASAVTDADNFTTEHSAVKEIDMSRRHWPNMASRTNTQLQHQHVRTAREQAQESSSGWGIEGAGTALRLLARAVAALGSITPSTIGGDSALKVSDAVEAIDNAMSELASADEKSAAYGDAGIEQAGRLDAKRERITYSSLAKWNEGKKRK